MKKILIIEDELSILKLLSYNLEQEGYDVTTAMDGEKGLDKAFGDKFDMILLDLMLPNINGMEICRQLRQEKIDVPIIMLTAKDTEVDKILGLEIGADDYITKPFSPREVLARMKAIFRRAHHKTTTETIESEEKRIDEKITVGELEIYPEKYEIAKNGVLLDITSKEFDVLLYLARRRGRILSREQLLDAIWDINFEGNTRIVDVHISHLREKIEVDKSNPKYLITVRGFGYKFEVPR